MKRSPAHRSRQAAIGMVQTTPRRACLGALLLLALATLAGCGVGTAASATPMTAPPLTSQGGFACLQPSHASAAGGCEVQDPATGISLRVVNAYADATSTVVQLQTTNSAGFPLDIAQPLLALASGRNLGAAGGTSGNTTALTIYEPIPSEDFSPQAQLVATAHFMAPVSNGMYVPSSPPPAPPWLADLGHIAVSVPFALSTAQSRAYTTQQAPVVSSGISVQVQSLAVSPASEAFYGPAGGASVELLFSGLPADVELLSFLRLSASESIAGPTEGDTGPGRIELQIPGMTVSTPAFTLLQDPAWPPDPGVPSVAPTVGPRGTARLKVSFQGTGMPTGQPATLSISQIQLLSGGIDGTTSSPSVLPDVRITLPMQ